MSTAPAEAVTVGTTPPGQLTGIDALPALFLKSSMSTVLAVDPCKILIVNDVAMSATKLDILNSTMFSVVVNSNV
mgnify:FL=1